MLISTGISSISESAYQNIQNNPSIKLTLCKRVCKIFSRLYEKISNLFSKGTSKIELPAKRVNANSFAKMHTLSEINEVLNLKKDLELIIDKINIELKNLEMVSI